MSVANAAQAGTGLSERIHALDALRATMLSFVVLFHAVMSYTTRPSAVWTFQDRMTTRAADFIVQFVHVFTLPTFFILAGFFSAMLYLRRGPEEFTHNRALRIALPFAVGWMILHPFVGAGFIFARAAKGASLAEGWETVQAALFDGSLFFPDSTIHLWFMYNLIFYYALALALVPVFLGIPAAWRDGAVKALASIVRHPLLRLVVLVPITMGMLWIVGGTLRVSLSFIPNLVLLFAYGLYFTFGWLLYLVRGEIQGFGRLAWTQTLIGVAIFVFGGLVLRLIVGGRPSPALTFVAQTSVGATLVWMFFFGLTGLFLRYCNRPSSVVRYLVDAAFWIYLVHLPLTIWLPGLFSGLTAPAGIKILMVLGITYVVAITTYDLFVRSTVTGFVLSGGRRPRALFGTANDLTSTQTAR